jgi:ribonuclease D
MISNDTFNYNFSKNSSISLAMLIKEYCGVEYEIKGEMHNLMSQNPYLWKERPISQKLNFYAGNDVIYLPKIYNIICSKCDKKIIKDISVDNIFKECEKYLKYVNINLKIKNFNKTNIQKGTEIEGLIK